ncbi:MAG: hypothetical protein A2Z14_08350 [Chloroflexi bacterium RBG_16_48_8]|nr:MAG: hypothetical protein A2Z14_08350 [Chloroflexi bacterium RBG_16_48_8]
MMKRTFGILILLAVCITPLSAFAAPPASGALLSAGQGSGNPGSMGVAVPITLESAAGVSIAALNFDLQYDESKLNLADVTLGVAAQAAEKVVASSLPANGTIRVVVYGLNQNAIGDGVVANIVFDVKADATVGSIPLNFTDAIAASPEATAVELQTAAGSFEISGDPTTFADVPRSHWAYGYIEALYQAGYISGCSAVPKLYCPEETLARGEMGVFVERGHHGADFTPIEPATPVFADTPPGVWSTKWAQAMYDDGYTAGCSTNPLKFCPEDNHLRNESTVYFERMLNGVDFYPPDPTSQFYYVDIPYGENSVWYSKWVFAAYNDQIIQECEDEANRADQLFRPFDGLTRAEAACMMAKAKELSPVSP